MKKFLARFGIDGFLVAIAVMILLAYFFPQPGLVEEPVSLEEVANYGVSLIFLFYGLRLSPRKMIEGLSNWRVHLVIQIATFILFPALVLLVRPFFTGEAAFTIWLAVFFLAALPSTVSSSVVMVSMARGNIPAAIFNASISSLIGVFVTPLWTGLFIASGTGGFNTSDIITRLTLQVLLPIAIGLMLHRRLGHVAERHKKVLRYFDQATILLIIYTSFCHSFYLHIFDGFTIGELLMLGVGMLALFFLVMGIIYFACRALRFSIEDRITALFCGSKKSLVHGTVMSKVLFSNPAITGIMLLPLMLYHALQLIAAGIIAQALAKRKEPS